MNPRTLRLKKIGLILVSCVLAAAAMLVLLLTAGAAAPKTTSVRADTPRLTDWVIVVGITGTVSVIDTSTDIVYGAVLSGQLGSEGGGLFDVAVSPDGQTALISNFGDSAVYFVDISNPISPSVITSVTTPMFAEDIAISPDGQFALVTDGGFSPIIAVIDMISRTLAYTVNMVYSDTVYNAQAVDIAPDGTVVVIGYFNGGLTSLYPDATDQLTVTGHYTYALDSNGAVLETGSTSGPDQMSLGAVGGSSTADWSGQGIQAVNAPWNGFVNVAIAPDGKTILVCDVNPYFDDTDIRKTKYYAVGVYQIIAPGVVTFTGVITGLERATQSIAFSADGTKAYLAGNGGGVDPSIGIYRYNALSVLNINGPGQVTLDRVNAVDYPRLVSPQLFGVDTIAAVNGKAYVSYPATSGASYDLRVVNLSDYSAKRLNLPGIPTGIAVIPLKRVYLPLVLKNTP